MSRHRHWGTWSPWQQQALIAIANLAGNSESDLARRMLARRIVRWCDIPDERFPAPHVFRDACGYIHLRWEYLDRNLEIMVSRPRSFRASVWRPGLARDCGAICDNLADGARQLFHEFFPEGTATLDEIMALTEVRR